MEGAARARHLLELPASTFESIEDVRRDAAIGRRSRRAACATALRWRIDRPAAIAAGIERIADVPIYFADAMVRRAPALQRTADARPPRARMNALTLQRLGVAEGGQVRVRQGRGEAVLAVAVDAACRRAWCASPPRIRRPAGSRALCGPIAVERA